MRYFRKLWVNTTSSCYKTLYATYAYIVSAFYDVIEQALEVTLDLFITPLDLIALLVVALLLDVVTAMLAAVRKRERDGDVYIQILERIGWRMLMYFSTTILAIGIANASTGRFAEPILGHLGVAVVLFYTLIELESIRSNWQALNFFKGAIRLMRNGTFEAPDQVMDSSDESSTDANPSDHA